MGCGRIKYVVLKGRKFRGTFASHVNATMRAKAVKGSVFKVKGKKDYTRWLRRA